MSSDQTEAPPLRATIIGGFLAVATPPLPAGTALWVVADGSAASDEFRDEPIGRITLPENERRSDELISQLSFFAPSGLPEAIVTIAVQSEGQYRSPTMWDIDVTSADDTILRIVKAGSVDIPSAASTDRLGRMLTLIWRALAAVPDRIGHGLDVATTIDGRLYIDGWVENAPVLGLFFMSADCSVVIPPGDVLFKKRMDVDALIKEGGRRTVTYQHGITVASVAPFEHVGQRIGLYANTAATCAIIDTVLLDQSAPPSSILARLWEAFSETRLPNPDFATRFIAPLLGTSQSSARTFTPVILHDSSVRPRLSIVVPLYGESFFVRSLLAMQQFMPEDFEWIFVCDDARIASAVADLMRRRTSFMAGRTVLVLNHDNYGYAASNNIGVLNATADTLLFMNSDIWIRSPEPVETALAALEAGQWSMLGFHLLFEDGTTQHGGISFVRHSDYGSLYLAEHPGKGLPTSVSARDAIRPTLAVTGALLMIRKAEYGELGGFNESFIKGDFEDADLCLRAISHGGRIGVVPTRECFHLERQSIRTIESVSARAAVTYCNCVTFNDLWADDLDRILAPQTMIGQAAG